MFKQLSLQSVYTSDDNDIAKEFYIPIFKHAVTFDRTSAYFSAKALALYSEGLEYFLKKGQKYRLIISKEITEHDFNEIKKGYRIRDSIIQEMVESMNEAIDTVDEQRLSNLAYFIAKGTVDIKIAFKPHGIFHDKSGIAVDENGDIICFRGSNNETAAAVNYNYESFQVTCSWLDSDGFYLKGIKKTQEEFEKLWNNSKEGIVVLPIDEVVVREIIKFNKGKVIVEEKMFEEDSAILDYDERLLLHINTPTMEWLTEKTFFKMRIKHKISKIVNKTIFFSSELTYTDFIKIDEILSKRIPDLGYKYSMTTRLNDYIQERNLYIEKRAMLGIELKTDPGNLNDRFKIFEEVVNNNMQRVLRPKQMRDAFFMLAMTKSANFSVPGSGKTSSALAVYTYLKHKGLIDKVVMVGPKNAFGSWIDEFEACFGEKEKLVLFNIQDASYKTNNERSYALKYESAKCNLFLFNYESLGSYLDEIIHLVSSKSLLVFDEAHKIKAINGQRATHALEIAKYSRYTIAMTGTPIPNSYLDLYNLLHILFNEEYKDFFGFDTSYLAKPLPTDIELINTKIQPFFCRTTKKELLVPDANEDSSKDKHVTDKEQRLFDIVCKKYRSNKLALFIRILQLESYPKMLLNVLNLNEFRSVLDLTEDIDDIDIIDYSEEVKELINSIDITTKMDETIKLTKQLVSERKPTVIWCIFKESIYQLHDSLNKNGIKSKYIMGEVKLEDRIELIRQFKDGEFEVLITNPHTLAESISLHTICHDAIYFEYSYNLVHLLQSKDRIHRLGLPKGQYTQYYFMKAIFNEDGEDISIDNRVYLRLKHKEQVMLDAIDRHKLEPTYTPEEDLEIIFKGLL